MRRMLALATVLLLVVAACGGDSGTESTVAGGSQAGTTQPGGDEGGGGGDDGGTNDTNPPDDSEGSGPSTATVTLGDQTYEFSTEGAIVAQCLTDLFGVFSVQLPMVEGGDAPGGGIQIVVLHEDTDPEVIDEVNSVAVSVGDEDWEADEDSGLFEQFEGLEPGMSQVDSAEIDGRTVRGTATFVRRNSVFSGEIETMTGSFEATCGEERTS